MELPKTETLALRLDDGALWVTLDRADVRNAMNKQLVEELTAVAEHAATDDSVRALVIRGSGGHLCAGGDIREMAAARATTPKAPGDADPLAAMNRGFGTMLTAIERCPKAVVVVAEGAAMGGGVGLCCAADITIGLPGLKVRLPETGLGIPPAQIAPFLVRRLGLSETRRLAVTGGSLDLDRCLAIGLCHETATDGAALEVLLAGLLDRIRKTAPGATAMTKRLVFACVRPDDAAMDAVLDAAATDFAAAARSAEAMEGMQAFLEKRQPNWKQA